jgi:hypothetical protein
MARYSTKIRPDQGHAFAVSPSAFRCFLRQKQDFFTWFLSKNSGVSFSLFDVFDVKISSLQTAGLCLFPRFWS